MKTTGKTTTYSVDMYNAALAAASDGARSVRFGGMDHDVQKVLDAFVSDFHGGKLRVTVERRA